MRVLVDAASIAAGRATVRGDDHHYLFRVRRLAPGARLVVFDGEGTEADAEVEQVAAEEAVAESGVSPEESTEVAEQYVFTITDGGFAKRTRISEYRLQSRGGIGIKAMKADDERGNLVGAFIVVEGDEVLSIKQSGQVTRSAIDEHLRPTGRDTKGVKFVGVNGGDSVVVVARSVERASEIEDAAAEAEEAAAEGATIDDDGAPVPSTDESTADGETEES
ncbi:MAG TPA: DNA gyrase C-terminal beta-propeller domain-containing protein [Nocardioidaceae bacterium]|nr:DNA gyrase C-terminal beta-propeller domain-containing protein [Nocardioidaceae bacterium]